MQKTHRAAQVQTNSAEETLELARSEQKIEHSFRTINKNWKKRFSRKKLNKKGKMKHLPFSEPFYVGQVGFAENVSRCRSNGDCLHGLHKSDNSPRKIMNLKAFVGFVLFLAMNGVFVEVMCVVLRLMKH